MITKTFRYRLEPKNHQRFLINKYAGSCRFVYNKCLSYFEDAFKQGTLLSYADLCKYLTRLKNNPEFSWLNEAPSQALQQSIKDLFSGITRFLVPDKDGNKLEFPRYQRRGDKDSMRYPQHFIIEDDRIYCPKVGWIRYRNSRPIEGRAAQVTIKREGDHWFVTIVCHIDRDPLTYRPYFITGIDVGINSLAVLSNGDVVENPRHLKKKRKRLAHEQKNLSRKEENSNRSRKQIKKIAKIHIGIKNARKDHLHKTSTKIVKSHDALAVESLHIRGMVKNHKLAQSISDASWGKLFRYFEYKCQWAGKELVKVPRNFPSSQLCSSCKVKQKMPLNVRTFRCKACGLVLDRDLNASKNIQAAGHAELQARGAIG